MEQRGIAMKKINRLVVLVFLLVSYACNNKTETQKFIENNKIDATVVISSLKTGKEYVIDEKRSEQRFLPASTFKILNTLIILQEEVIKDENEIVKWDGIEKGLPEWNKDQNLKTALPSSCVWFYQELAKKVGIDKYTEYLQELNYGNSMVGLNADNFWLEGDIRISAKEQISFLRKLYLEEYGFNKEYYDILKVLLTEEENASYKLFGKTGWAQRINPQVGWYVGYIETKIDTWFFAANLTIQQDSDSDYRKKLVMNFLSDLKIIK